MTFTLTFAWWWIPAAITVIGVVWAMSFDDGGGYLSGIGNIFALIPALGASLVAWIIAAVLK